MSDISIDKKRNIDDLVEEGSNGDERKVKIVKVEETSASEEAGKASADSGPNSGGSRDTTQENESREGASEAAGAKEAKVDEDKPEEKVEQDKVEETPENVTDKQPEPAKKFVFGSTTGFGNMGGFKMFGMSKNVFAATSGDKEEPAKDTETTTEIKTKTESACKSESETKPDAHDEPFKPKSIFGSNSTFENAFQNAINKKNVFDEIKKETTPVDLDATTELPDVYKKVHLEKQDIKSGEEDETTLFQVKAKLYHMELSKVEDGWKEKGFGIIKVNKLNNTSDTYTSRLVMRQNGNLKLILNMPIVKGLNVMKGMPSSLSAGKFIRIQLVEDGIPIQYAIKVGQVENASLLFETIERQIPK